ncbi:MAG: hypothetical protein H0X31_19985 [Nostocaceae cyanobacterium]|nr:hypothetical protein [Nostocaceae cyanobacterium]
MECLALGAKSYLLMTEEEPTYKVSLQKILSDIIQVAQKDELLDAMNAIAHKLGYRRNFSDVNESQSSHSRK